MAKGVPKATTDSQHIPWYTVDTGYFQSGANGQRKYLWKMKKKMMRSVWKVSQKVEEQMCGNSSATFAKI